MALEAVQALRGRLLHEGLLQVFRRQAEGDVHARAGVLLRVAAIEAAAFVDGAVDAIGLVDHLPLHRAQAALVLQPLQHQAHHVDGERGRRVVERLVLGHELVVQDGGQAGGHPGQEVAADDHHRDPGRSQVLLRARVEQAVARHRQGPAQEVGGGVAHQGHPRRRLRLGEPLGAVDGVVGGEVQVGRPGVGLELAVRGNPVELRGFRRSRDPDGAQLLGLLDGGLRPVAGQHVVGRHAGRPQVHGEHGELLRGAALQEQHRVVRGEAQERAQVGFGSADDVLESRGPMAHLHDRHPRAPVVEQLGAHLLQDGQGQDGRAGGEVVDAGRRGRCHPHRINEGGRPEPGPREAASGRDGSLHGLERLYDQHQREAKQQHRDGAVQRARVELQTTGPRCLEGGNGLEHQRAQRHRHHEGHGPYGKGGLALRAAQPHRDPEEEQGGHELVGGAEQNPERAVRPLPRHQEEDEGHGHGEQGGREGTRSAPPAKELLERVAAQAGSDVEGVEDEGREGHGPEGGGERAVLLADDQRQVVAEARAVDGPRRLARELGVAGHHHGAERDHGHERLEKHGPVAHGPAVRFLRDLLRGRARADEAVKAGAGAAGDGHEQEGEERPGRPRRGETLEGRLLHGETAEETSRPRPRPATCRERSRPGIPAAAGAPTPG